MWRIIILILILTSCYKADRNQIHDISQIPTKKTILKGKWDKGLIDPMGNYNDTLIIWRLTTPLGGEIAIIKEDSIFFNKGKGIIISPYQINWEFKDSLNILTNTTWTRKELP